MKLSIIPLMLVLSSTGSLAQSNVADPSWDEVSRALWRVFPDRPHMIDACALKIAHEVEVDPSTGWPAYCNSFKDTAPVLERVEDVKNQLSAMKLPASQRRKLAEGKIWIGATAQMALLSWGRPESINRTITSGGASEQWVYPSRNYLYVTNGRVTGIQNR